MSSLNLNDAKKECSESPNCHMFYDLEGAGDWFVACEVTSSIHDTTSSSYGTILYTKQHGNITHHLMFKDKVFKVIGPPLALLPLLVPRV